MYFLKAMTVKWQKAQLASVSKKKGSRILGEVADFRTIAGKIQDISEHLLVTKNK